MPIFCNTVYVTSDDPTYSYNAKTMFSHSHKKKPNTVTSNTTVNTSVNTATIAINTSNNKPTKQSTPYTKDMVFRFEEDKKG